MNKNLILQLRDKAVNSVSSKRTLSDGQIERTWLQDEADLEFARLVGDLFILDNLKSKVNIDQLYRCYERWTDSELCSYFDINQYELELLLGIQPTTDSWIKE